MNEASKTRRRWDALDQSIYTGQGIDIGCGNDPILPEVRRFDVADGDANAITEFVNEQFDFVFSSHCLEHMHDPHKAIQEWWKLVKPGGHLIFIVPDEDLYEQGVFPSRFNSDHKATFTISKQRSWSPVSVNVIDLVNALPDGDLVRLVLQDNEYDRSLLRHGEIRPPRAIRLVLYLYRLFEERMRRPLPLLWRLPLRYAVVDQTVGPETLAQIQCIVRKRLNGSEDEARSEAFSEKGKRQPSHMTHASALDASGSSVTI